MSRESLRLIAGLLLHEVGPSRVAGIPLVCRQEADELTVLDLHEHETRRRLLGTRIRWGHEPVRIELMDVLQRIEDALTSRVGAGSLQRLHEQSRRRPAVHGEEIDRYVRVRLLHPREEQADFGCRRAVLAEEHGE